MRFLDYGISQEEAVVTYHAGDIVFACHSDALYLSESKAHSRARGNFPLSNNTLMPANNGVVLNVAKIIETVMTSAVEAKIWAMFINAREVVPQQMTLVEIGHPQPITPMQTENYAVHSVVNNMCDQE